jgi:prepilin-type N-terminal cleavage/methylation domain-containing protein
MRIVAVRNESGVTLVELLVVMIIVSIALAVVVPSMGKSYEKWVLQSSARSAVAFLRLASDSARREGVNFAAYYTDHHLVLLRNGSMFKELNIPVSISVRPEKPRSVVFVPTGQIVAAEPYELSDTRGRKVRIEFGPLPGQVGPQEAAP